MEKEIILIWKKLNVGKGIFNFSCGGDSMNDTDLFFETLVDEDGIIERKIKENKKNKEDLQTLFNYFDSEIYNKVEFYVNSDGDYQGEFGSVEITLLEDGEEFDYSKNSQSEWCESVTSVVKIPLDNEMVKFINEKILNIIGDEGDCQINFKVDCLLSDKEDELLEKLEELVNDELSGFTPEGIDEDINDYYSFTTNEIDEEGNSIKIKDNELYISIDNSYYCYKDE